MNTNSPFTLLLIVISCFYATFSIAQPTDPYTGGFEQYGQPVPPQNPPPPNNNHQPPPPPQNNPYNYPPAQQQNNNYNYPPQQQQQPNYTNTPPAQQPNYTNTPPPQNNNYNYPPQNSGFEYNGQPIPPQQQPPANLQNEKSVLTNSGFEGWDVSGEQEEYGEQAKKKKRKKKKRKAKKTRNNKHKNKDKKRQKRNRTKKKKDVMVQKNIAPQQQPRSLSDESFAPNSPNVIRVDLDGLYNVDIEPAVEVRERRKKSLSFKDKEDIKYLFNQSILKVNAKDFETALIYLNKCVTAEPFNKEYLQMRGNVNSELGKFKKAIKDYNKAIEADRADPLLHYNKASTLLKMDKLKEAVKAYDRAILIDPAYINALQGRASAKTLLGDYESSIMDYNRVLDQAAFFIPALKGRGVSKSLVGRYDEAVNDFTFIIQKQPMDGMAYYYRGLAYVGMNQVYQGCSDFDKAYQLKVPQAYYEIKETCR